MRFARRAVSACGAIVVLALMPGGGVVVAQGPVQACVNPQSGEVKVLLAAGTCRPGWVAVPLSSGGGGGGMRVIDANDQDVGAYEFSPQSVGGVALRRVGSYWLAILVGESGFFTDDVALSYESTDCSGTPLVFAEQPDLLSRYAVLSDGLLRFAGDPIAPHTVRSQKILLEDGSVTACVSFGPGFLSPALGPETTVDPDTLGLTPPFRLVDQ